MALGAKLHGHSKCSQAAMHCVHAVGPTAHPAALYWYHSCSSKPACLVCCRVSSSKYMAAVDKAKQLRAKCAEQEAALADAGKLREELGRVQQQLGALHSTCSALKSQLKAAREQQAEAGSAREHLLAAQVGQTTPSVYKRGGSCCTGG